MTLTVTETAPGAAAPNPFAAEDSKWVNVDNPNDAYANFEHLRPIAGRQINAIATDSEPHILRNVATYYEAKEETWATAMASRLRTAALPANDNKPAAASKRNRRAA